MFKNRSLLIPFLLLSLLALLAGLWAGLARLGWTLPAVSAEMPGQHGSLMVSGFLGTLIALERVAALRRRWMLLAPLFSASGWLLGLLLPGIPSGVLLITLASAVFTAILVVMVRREPAVYTGAMAVGAASWLAGNLLWAGGLPVYRVAWLWAAFLVLTIAGERLELSRVLGLGARQYRSFAAAAGLFLLGALLQVWLPRPGLLLAGLGLLALCAWLLRYDIARRNLRHPAALTRYIAACLFSGYLWLGLGGLLAVLLGPQRGGPLYDAQLHAVFVGFVFTMIFGHAPIILPALTGLMVPFRRTLYLPLGLLHLSLALRVGGDLALHPGAQAGITARLWGGLLNEAAVLAFFGLFLGSAARQAMARRRAGATPAPDDQPGHQPLRDGKVTPCRR